MALSLITSQEFRSSQYGDMADQVDDIDSFIERAESYIENKLDRKLASASYTEVHRPSGCYLYLRQRPLISLTSIDRRSSYTDSWSSLSLSNFELEPNGALGVVHSLADEIKTFEVKVVYAAGYAAIPPDIKQAVIAQTVLYAYQDLEVFGGGDGKEPAIKHLKVVVEDILAEHKKARLM